MRYLFAYFFTRCFGQHAAINEYYRRVRTLAAAVTRAAFYVQCIKLLGEFTAAEVTTLRAMAHLNAGR